MGGTVSQERCHLRGSEAKATHLQRARVLDLGLDVGGEPDDVLAGDDLGRLGLGAVVLGALVAAQVVAVDEAAVVPRGHVAVVVLAHVLVGARHLVVDDEVREVVVCQRQRRGQGREGEGREVLHGG